MALIVFGTAYLAASGIWAIVIVLAKGVRLRAFKSFAPTLLSPLGTIFALFVAFIVAQVWSALDRAESALNREASALRTVVLLASSFPKEQEAQIRGLVRRHVDEAVNTEWPTMAIQSATLEVASPPLAEALQLALSFVPNNEGQIVAQREIVTAVENALDARRQCIILSRSSVNWVKWSCLFAQAICMFVAIAIVHSHDRIAAGIALGIFATGVSVSMLLIASHDRPFSGEISVKPDVLLQVRPD